MSRDVGSSRRRVAVTGLGVASALGNDVGAFWESLLAGRCAFAPVKSFDVSAYRTRIGAEMDGRLPREALAYLRHAAGRALADAGLRAEDVKPSRVGVAIGTTSGELGHAERLFNLRLGGKSDSAQEARYGPGRLSAALAAELGFKGPVATLTTACAAGNFALIHAFERIASGRADVMLAGGADVFSRISYAGFNRLLALAPEHAAPFSLGRKGLVCGEGAAVLVLEDYERAMKTGRRVYAELAGYGVSSDAAHVTLPQVAGVARALAQTLETCGLRPDDVEYVNAHGTGTPANDKTETAAIKQVFGAAARKIPVSSIKSMLGHSMGAASAFEAVATCLVVHRGAIPPTVHFTPGDPDCDLDYVPNAARKKPVSIAFSDAFAFGGCNTVVAFTRPGAARPPEREVSRVVVTGIGTAESAGILAAAARELSGRDLSFLDAPSALCAVAVGRALADAGILSNFERGGLIVDSTGETESLFEFYRDLVAEGPDGVEPRKFPNTLANAAASRAAILFGLKAVNESFGGCFPGGEEAVAAGYDFVARRGADFIVAGGVDDGAAMLVLEPAARARARGARVYAEIAGFEESSEPLFEPRESAGCFCLAEALGALKGDLDYVGRGRWGAQVRLYLRK